MFFFYFSVAGRVCLFPIAWIRVKEWIITAQIVEPTLEQPENPSVYYYLSF